MESSLFSRSWEILEHFLPLPEDPEAPLPPFQRFLRDLYHSQISYFREMVAISIGLRGYLRELFRNGYPSRVQYTVLRGDPFSGNLLRLKRLNPQWPFREGFDPSSWVVLFLHGYVDNAGADRAIHRLKDLGYTVYLFRYPFLRKVEEVAEDLREVLGRIRKVEGDKVYVPLGHSLGGVVWESLFLEDPEFFTTFRVPLYVPMGTPHFGTILAYLALGKSRASMIPKNSVYMRGLARGFPEGVEVYPFVSRFDLCVLPVETALWGEGVNYIFSETGHIGLSVLDDVLLPLEEVFATDGNVLRSRAIYRPFFPDSLTFFLKQLPDFFLSRLGLFPFFQYLNSSNGKTRSYYLRVVPPHPERSDFPRLRRWGKGL